MNLDLSGKSALVCGSTQGIGKATAMELADLGGTINSSRCRISCSWNIK